ILTNHHVTNEDKNVVIKLKNGNFKKVQQTILTNNSRKNDIVLLKVNGYYPDYLDLAPRSPIVGDYVFVIGHPKDKKEWNFSKGRIMGFGNMEYGNIQISAHVNFGSSGSAICNSKGQLIGQINSKLIKGKQILGLGLSLNGIKKFLKNTGNSKILKKRKTNIWMEDLAKNHISESINKYLNADKVEVVASYPLQNSQLIIAKRNYKSKKFLFVCNGFTADEIDEFKIGDKINISGVIKNYSFQKRTCKINIYQCSTKKYRELKNNNRKNKQVDNTNTWKGNINFLYYIFNCIIDYIKDIFYYIMSLF
ncbi:MAG: trypsin-like peptidase domain-containing protein, partial [bacterium]|nr:trypsin-like peptidase domain-containing protein [bacterium]